LVTAELPDRPGYFAQDAEINRTGASPLDALAPLHEFPPDEVQRSSALVLDTRPVQQFCAGHVPGAIHIALSGQYASWAATLIGLAKDIILVAEDEQHLEESRMRLARVGIERVIGTLAGGMSRWAMERHPVAEIAQIPVEDLNRELADVQVIDVRKPAE